MPHIPDPDAAAIRVLLVEDDPGAARHVREQLARATAYDFDIATVAGLSQAVQALSADPFDVVLMDLSVPHQHGLEAIHHLEAACPEVAIIVLSEETDEAFALRAVQAGAQDYLIKGHADGHLMARSIRYAIERRREKARLVQLAQYDALTGLANRTLFHDILAKALARAGRSGLTVALMFLDLDNFKIINDTLGHHVGDELLQAVAARLRTRIREGDSLARLGGDEFTVIMEGVARREDMERVARNIVKAMVAPFSLAGHKVHVTASIGIALSPAGTVDADNLIKNADTAMYRAKEQGRNGIRLYDPHMGEQAQRRLKLEHSLRHAIDRQELVVHYQPQMDLRNGDIVAVEALLRWQPAGGDLVFPGDFLPLAEETGLIVPIGEWLFYTLCADQRRWRAAGLAPVRATVNLSSRQFQSQRLMKVVQRYLSLGGVRPHDLELEVSESLLMDDRGISAAVLAEMRALGVPMALDDFGAGHSSLRFLKRYPITTLKIAQAFVRNIGSDPDDVAIASAIIALGHSLGLKVIAEGVETRDQLEFFRRASADAFQGFIFSGAVPADDVVRMMQRQVARRLERRRRREGQN